MLSECDVVLYDNLAPMELVVTLPEHIEKRYVGKKAGQPCLSQEEINALLVKLAQQGKKVVRLKGSDPLIFGRGAEEAKFLKEHNIPFEIVPGVTSGIAVPAYAGIPCTDREHASYVLFVTGHKAKEKEASDVPWGWVAKGEEGTTVIYMGVGEIGGIVSRLLAEGKAPDTPAAVIERGTLPSQRVEVCRLDELPDMVEKKRIRPPALFVLGEVVSLREWLKWFEKNTLFGLRVMVTRPAAQAQEMYQALRRLGAEVVPCPTLATTPHDDNEGWEKFAAVDSLKRWLVFTSENGVRYFMHRFEGEKGDVRSLHTFRIAVVGEGTARALKKYLLSADFIPSEATVATLARELKAQGNWDSTTVVRVRGNWSDEIVENTLSQAGAKVIPLTVYRAYFPALPEGMKEKILAYPPDVVTFTSGSTVKGLFELFTPEEVKQLTEKATLLSIGPSTSAVVAEYGLKVALEAKEHTIPAMLETLVAYARQHSLRRS